MAKNQETEVEKMFREWCGHDPGCPPVPALTPAQLQRVLCFAEYVRVHAAKMLVAGSVQTVNM